MYIVFYIFLSEAVVEGQPRSRRGSVCLGPNRLQTEGNADARLLENRSKQKEKMRRSGCQWVGVNYEARVEDEGK